MGNNNLLDVVSYVLSTMTVVLCVFLKVPQIVQIRQRQTAEGLYAQALLMEIMGFSIVTLYNFMNNYSLMTYLEYPIILLQVIVMLYYVLLYTNMLTSILVPTVFVAYVTVVGGILTELIPLAYLSNLVPLCTPLSGFAKVTYIYGMYKVQHAETTSLYTWAISIFTNFSRLYTIYMDSADSKLIFNLTVSSLLSIAVFMTAFYYKILAKPRTQIEQEACKKALYQEKQRSKRYFYEHEHNE